MADLVASSVSVFVWKYLIKPLGCVFGIYELLPAFLVSIAAIVSIAVIVSLLTMAPGEDILRAFETAKADHNID